VQSLTPEGEPAAPADPSGFAEPADPGPQPRRRLVLLVVTAVVVLALDVATKAVVVATMTDGQRIPLLGDTVSLYLIRNSGAAFSLATGMTWVLTLVALAVVVGIARFARRLRSAGWAVALGLVLGGALGNLADRFFRGPGPLEGHVVDFVSVGWWPVFNAADSAICCGGALLVILALWGVEIDGRLSPRAGEGREAGDAR
jgi:signal peptidase II